MKIVIVGGGISGLACYLFLRKNLPSAIPPNDELDITIVESHAAGKRVQRSGAATTDEAAGRPGSEIIGAALGLGRYTNLSGSIHVSGDECWGKGCAYKSQTYI